MRHGDRTALVTGGARGIGLEIGRQLADRGLRVLVGARKRAAAEEACRAIGPAALPLALDVTSARSVSEAVREARELTGGIDVLVNNAGVSLDGELRPPYVDEGLLRATLDTNLTGAWRVLEALVPDMVEAGYGRVVNVTSSYGSLALMDSGRHPAYRISKTALNALTRMLAAELAGTGVLVNAADPGWTRSGMGGPSAPRGPEEGADTPVWLATLPEGDGTTGGLFADRRPLPW
ncbi:SDR family NAD(P)-dependent oxidoreductase [Streptomyces sp. DSM 40750]|uniref:SDR family NAD(P)-dependent oxidoreductase n=1 Tax=Streptomyces sp. DSM 40750 TaxID=2801030 RepID=UPI00214BD414|nr:SDR family NAD(P)-dependent oxidoreductase [Streptomyces sp. DSM 40750]UUU19388.1 SDR family NAD(P)-dependent oxidoreductase [Streptomyces sp. DSM 40750]UUU27268.1 SDR family NAD(P)-dependent oxidoreductase [Streptomyces sp. DSM 40750]